MTELPRNTLHDASTPDWPRDFDVRASRAEQQEVQATPLTHARPEEGETP